MLSKGEFRAVFEKAMQQVLTKAPQNPIGDSEDFSDYGLDSLDLINILLHLENDLGVQIEEVDLAEVNSLDKLYAYLIEQRQD